jgi:hypothetical protein
MKKTTKKKKAKKVIEPLNASFIDVLKLSTQGGVKSKPKANNSK